MRSSHKNLALDRTRGRDILIRILPSNNHPTNDIVVTLKWRTYMQCTRTVWFSVCCCHFWTISIKDNTDSGDSGMALSDLQPLNWNWLIERCCVKKELIFLVCKSRNIYARQFDSCYIYTCLKGKIEPSLLTAKSYKYFKSCFYR